MDTNRELEAILELIPKNLIVRVREGGGPENIIASLAVSVQKLVSENERFTNQKSLNIEKVVIETDDWRLGAYMEWRPKHHEESCIACNGKGVFVGGLGCLDEPAECRSCYGLGKISKGPATSMPQIPENLREHMRRAWWDFVNNQNRLQPPITNVEITEKMCETGNRALYGERWLHMPEMQKSTANRWMRDALTAVLHKEEI